MKAITLILKENDFRSLELYKDLAGRDRVIGGIVDKENERINSGFGKNNKTFQLPGSGTDKIRP
jgi:hypothetical protein